MTTTLETIRPPARAGQFYPGDPADMNAAIDRLLPIQINQQTPYRAIMLPHAGWLYSGQTLGKTLARAAVPDIAFILGPKHTPYGPIASVASHEQWKIPGATIPIATDLAHRLTEKIRGLQCEPEAHRMEHGSEVLLPFLHRVNPNIHVLPIVLGQITLDDACGVGRAIARLVQEIQVDGCGVLLVISSDMNHFATEAENRRLDHLTIDAMTTGDPRKLYDVCTNNRISMCGVLPAVAVMESLRQATPEIKPELVNYTTSGDASGDHSRVVGYAGVVIA